MPEAGQHFCPCQHPFNQKLPAGGRSRAKLRHWRAKRRFIQDRKRRRNFFELRVEPDWAPERSRTPAGRPGINPRHGSPRSLAAFERFQAGSSGLIQPWEHLLIAEPEKEDLIYELLRKPVRITGKGRRRSYTERIESVHVMTLHSLAAIRKGSRPFVIESGPRGLRPFLAGYIRVCAMFWLIQMCFPIHAEHSVCPQSCTGAHARNWGQRKVGLRSVVIVRSTKSDR